MNRKIGKKDVVVKYSEFYQRYFLYSDLTKEELMGVEGIESAYVGPQYAELEIHSQYDDRVVLKNIKKLAANSSEFDLWKWIKKRLGYGRDN